MKYTMITGASSGIGYAVAKAFAKRGKNIIAVARRGDKLAELKQEIEGESPGVEVVTLAMDLSSTQNAYALYQAVEKYDIETWMNNAGFGDFDMVADQDLDKISTMLHLNIETLTILTTLYVRDYENREGTQLINVSSAGGYTVVPSAVTYCASKFFVSAFTEGLDIELRAKGAKMRAKVLAPAATETDFANVANDIDDFSYQERYAQYHTVEEIAAFTMDLYDSDATVGLVHRSDFSFHLSGPLLQHLGAPTIKE